MASTPTPLKVKSAAQIRTDYLRTLENGLTQIGVPQPNVGYGSDYYAQGQALATEIEPIYAAIAAGADAFMPDSATGTNLDRVMAIFAPALPGRRDAGPSSGNLLLSSSSTTFIPKGAQLLDVTGNAYRVTIGGAYAPDDIVPCVSVSKGLGTNLAPGAVLRWLSPPPFVSPTSPVDTRGFSGGADAELDDDARARLLTFLGSAPGNGNSAHIKSEAEADLSAQAVYGYPAANGPGTCHVAVVGYATSSLTGSRVVSDAVLAQATSNVFAAFPEFAEYVVTKSADQRVDFSMLLQLPSATTAIPAGTGGGWIDGAPFPAPANTTLACAVTSVTSSTAFAIGNCAASPTIGATIQWVDPSTLTLKTSHVLTVSSFVAGVAAITVDAPFVGIAVGDYVSPGAVNMQTYVTAVLTQFQALGPGEKTDAAGLLPRAFRRPRWFETNDYHFGPKFKKAVEDSGDEVFDVQWGYQNGGTTTPALPTSIELPPSIFVPRRIAFYAMES